MKLKALTLLFAFFILAVIVLADTGHLGILNLVYQFPNGDKAGHFLLFGIMSFLLNLTSLRSLRLRRPARAALIVTLILALAVGLEEWSQALFSGRLAEWLDLVFSYLGIVTGASGAWVFRPARKPDSLP